MADITLRFLAPSLLPASPVPSLPRISLYLSNLPPTQDTQVEPLPSHPSSSLLFFSISLHFLSLLPFLFLHFLPPSLCPLPPSPYTSSLPLSPFLPPPSLFLLTLYLPSLSSPPPSP